MTGWMGASQLVTRSNRHIAVLNDGQLVARF